MTRTTKSPKGPVEKFSVSISPEAAKKLETFCEKNDRGKSWAVDKLIMLYLEKLQ